MGRRESESDFSSVVKIDAFFIYEVHSPRHSTIALPRRIFFRFALIKIHTDLKNVNPLLAAWLWEMVPTS